jgi:uncharacterized peroxidase-related enzyme
MTNINPATEQELTPKGKELLEMVNKKMGRVPNMMATLAHAPSALEAYLQLSGALSGASINKKEQEQIALLVGTKNDCAYCVKAHSAIGKLVGLTDEAVEKAKLGEGVSERDSKILKFANLILDKQGHIGKEGVDLALSSGLTKGEIFEIITAVSLNIFTNYVNHVADPVIDF